jgi:hypothetical protein
LVVKTAEVVVQVAGVKQMAEANPHIGKLIEARAQIVNARREVAVALAEPSRRDRGELYEDFVRMQGVIEAIARAIEDERQIEQKQSEALRAGDPIRLQE